MGFKIKVNNLLRSLGNKSGTICAIVGVIGVGTTAYFSAKGAVKADHLIDPDLDKKEKAKVYLKTMWPAGVAGLATVGAIVGSDRIHVKKEVALAGVAAIWKRRFTETEGKVRDIYGDEALNEIHKEIANDHMKENPYKGEAPDVSKGEKIYYEPYTDQYLKCTEDQLKEAYYEGNKRFTRDGELSLNFIIGYLGGDTNKVDDKYGWYYESEIQEYCWSHYGGPWIEPIKSVYMYKECKNTHTPLRYRPNNESPESGDIRCLFYDVDPIMPTSEDMLYSEEV